MRLFSSIAGIFIIGAAAWANDPATNNAAMLAREFESLRAKAKSGDASAEFNLGKCYYEGQGVAEDKPEAIKWLEKAAAHGVVEAQMLVGIVYWNGMNVKIDEVKGVKWFEKAAEQGEPGAFHYLGAAYYLGRGVKQDYIQCYKWTLLFKDSGRSVIREGPGSVEARIADLEQKMTVEQIKEGKRLAEKSKKELAKTPGFSQGHKD